MLGLELEGEPALSPRMLTQLQHFTQLHAITLTASFSPVQIQPWLLCNIHPICAKLHSGTELKLDKNLLLRLWFPTADCASIAPPDDVGGVKVGRAIYHVLKGRMSVLHQPETSHKFQLLCTETTVTPVASVPASLRGFQGGN